MPCGWQSDLMGAMLLCGIDGHDVRNRTIWLWIRIDSLRSDRGLIFFGGQKIAGKCEIFGRLTGNAAK